MKKSLPLAKTSMRLSVPFNHADDYLDKVIRPYAGIIGEVYLPVHVSVAPTGRRWHGPADAREYDRVVEGLYRELKKLKIRMGFAVNLYPERFSDALRIEGEIVRLHAMCPGSSFFLSAFESAVRLHERDESIDLHPSTLARVNDPARARYWKEAVGSSTITVDRAVNRRPEVLSALKRMGLALRMVVNDWCLPNCPNEYAHVNQLVALDEYNLSRGEAEALEANPCRPCMLVARERFPWLVAQKEVLPGNLRHLEGLVDLVKLQGRDWISDDIAGAVASYGEMESLSSLWFSEPPEAWEQIAGCDRVCEECGWCEENILPGEGKS